jgi:phosphoribosylaminoimidazole-succinocarboxamide synthase
MNKLKALFDAVKESSLSKYALEAYRDELSQLFADFQLELGEVKKEKAKFLLGDWKTTAEALRAWAGTEKGLREIELKSYIRASSPILNSLKARLYSMF